jgi:fumarate reductase subunit C
VALVETTQHAPQPTRAAAYWDVLQALTGAGLVLFMWSHMMLVSSVLLGPEVMNRLAEFFERTYMAQVGGPLLAALFVLHFVLAVRKVPFRIREQKAIWRHARMFRHHDTWMWLVQAVTGMVVLILGAIHIWVVLSNLPITAERSAARIQGGFWLGLYCVLLPMVELHVGLGFYRVGVKWGIFNRKRRGFGKGLEVLTTIFFLTIGVITLVTFATLELGS